MDRRNFIKGGLLAAAVGVMSGPKAVAREAERQATRERLSKDILNYNSQMQYRPMGRTGVSVLALGFGMLRLPMKNGHVDFDQTTPMVHRAIGVSNFQSDRIIDICYTAEIKPMVNQLELHPFYQREDELAILREYGIVPQAWAPFAEGMNGMFTNLVLKNIAEGHGKTVAQIILRWIVQRGVSVIPKSVHQGRMEENIGIWDFELSAEDMRLISTLDLSRPLMLDPRKPSEVHRLFNYLDNPVLTSL